MLRHENILGFIAADNKGLLYQIYFCENDSRTGLMNLRFPFFQAHILQFDLVALFGYLKKNENWTVSDS